MSQQTHNQTRLARTSHLYIGADLLLALASELQWHISPSPPPPISRFSAWRRTEDDGDHPATWLTHSLLLQPEPWQANTRGSTTVRLHRHPERHRVLQTGVSVKRHLSRIFPAPPRSLASALVPRPSARRCSASHYVRPAGLGFQRKNLPAAAAQSTGEIFVFGASAESTSRHLGAGHLASLRAGVSRGQSGKYKQGETPWHSTKTKSL